MSSNSKYLKNSLRKPTGKGRLSKEGFNFLSDPFFEKQAEASKKVFAKYGFPKELLIPKD